MKHSRDSMGMGVCFDSSTRFGPRRAGLFDIFSPFGRSPFVLKIIKFVLARGEGITRESQCDHNGYLLVCSFW